VVTRDLTQIGLLAVWIAAGAALAGSAACGGLAPAARAEATDASTVVVTGRVETADGSLTVGGRGVEAVNLHTGERHSVLTTHDGAFAMPLRPGTWRLELRLEPGEWLATSPAPITVAASAAPRGLQFRVARVLYRPQRPATPRPLGLGSPIA
jgi:hypothetical protein